MTASKAYKVPRRTCVLELNGDYAGAEARCCLDIDVGTFFEIAALQDATDDAAKVKEAMVRFGDEILIEWNLVDDNDQPLPATAEGFLRLPLPIATAMMNGWTDAIQDVPAPLSEPPKGPASASTPLKTEPEKS